jgi:bacteriophage exclusion system BrxB-like protein
MTPSSMNNLSERLFRILSHPNFLSMKAQANEVPIFIQTYDPTQEDAIRRMVESLAGRLRNNGITLKALDLFNLVLEELEECHVLADLLKDEATFEKIEVLETLQNYSDPKGHLIPRLIRAIGNEGAELTLITGSGRIFPFLRTHTILESLQPAMLRHPVVIFFPGEYDQDPNGGSHLRLFGSIPSPKINNPYYRATNLEHFRI